MSCLSFTALWLQRSQSILMQEIHPAKDINLTCFKTFPIKATTCIQVGPLSLDWPVDPIARFDQSRPSSFSSESNDEQQQGALPVSTSSRWRQNALQAFPQVPQRTAGWDGCGPFSLMEFCDVLLGTPGVLLDHFSQQKNRIQTQIPQKSFFDNSNNILCLQEVHGRDQYRRSAFTGIFYLKRLL